MPASKMDTVHEGLMVLNTAFVDHCKADERYFATISKAVDSLPDMAKSIEQIKTSLVNEREDFSRFKEVMEGFDERLRSLEKWKWGVVGAFGVLGAVGAVILKHILNIQF